MIFCTVGNDHRRFIRFEEVVRKLAASHQLVFQHGHSNPVFHENVANVDFLSGIEFEDHIKRATEVYSHGGAGTLLLCSQLGKRPKILSREKKYGEHLNDHQAEIVSAFFELGLIDKIDTELDSALKRSAEKINTHATTRLAFINILTEKIEKYLK